MIDASSSKVDAFVRSRLAGANPIAIPAELRPATLQEGYAIQAAAHDALAQHHDPVLGYKVGCVTAESRVPLGLSEPVYGGMFRSTYRPSLAAALDGCEGAWAIECEVAMRIGRAVPASAGLMRDDIRRCVDGFAIGCEVVQNRYGDPIALGAPTIAGDDFFHYRYAVGEWRGPDQIGDLSSVRASLWLDGAHVETQRAADVMGDPLQSVAWLATALARVGRTLRAGDVVLTGSIVTPYWVKAPLSSVRMQIDGLGDLATR